MTRTERESDRRKEVADLLVLLRPAKGLQNGISGKTRAHLACRKEQGGLSATKRRQSCLCQKEKKQSRLSKVPDSKVGQSQGERETHLGDRGGSEQEHGKERVSLQ